MITPRADRVKIALQFGIVQFGRDALPRELHVEVGIQRLHHHQADGNRIHAAPGLGAIDEQLELRRQRIPMRGDEEVDAAGVVVQAGAVGRGQAGVDAPSRIAKLEYALHLIVPDERGSEDLRQFAVGVAAQNVHLPQAVLGGHIALGHK